MRYCNILEACFVHLSHFLVKMLRVAFLHIFTKISYSGIDIVIIAPIFLQLYA